MICHRALTEEQKIRSQHYCNLFNAVNGLSYMCLGETVLILLAVKLHCPDSLITTLGAMIYLGFLLLPLGKIMTAQVGAARSQASFWIYRNIAALLVASATLWNFWGHRLTAWTMLIIGAFLFYGFRAAGVIMSQPLLGDITDNRSRARVVSVNWGLFNLACLLALLTISVLLKFNSSIWMLTGVIVIGSALGMTASRFIRRVDETAELRRTARQPVTPVWRIVWRQSALRLLVVTEFMLNLAIIMVVPVSMLTLKRGYGISDSGALLFALLQFGASSLVAFVSVKLIDRFGARRMIFVTYGELLVGAALWLGVPDQISLGYCGLIFFLLGGISANASNCVACYFLQLVPVKQRIATSILRSIITGVGAGVCGMFLSGIGVKIASEYCAVGINVYRGYFGGVLIILLLGFFPVLLLKKLPGEK